MTAVKGYIQGNNIIADDFLLDSFDGSEVIITILDSFKKKSKKAAKNKIYTSDDVKDAFGMWKDHTASEDVEDYVRSLRKGRKFDI